MQFTLPDLPESAHHVISLPLSPLSDKQIHFFYEAINDTYYLVTNSAMQHGVIGRLTGQQLFQLFRTISPTVSQIVAEKEKQLTQLHELLIGAEQTHTKLLKQISDLKDDTGNLNEQINALRGTLEAKDRTLAVFQQGMQTLEATFSLIYNAAQI